MTYYTILMITILSGPLEGSQEFLIYNSYEQCFEAHQIVSDTLGYDHQISCEVTDTPSGSIRPKARPERME